MALILLASPLVVLVLIVLASAKLARDRSRFESIDSYVARIPRGYPGEEDD